MSIDTSGAPAAESPTAGNPEAEGAVAPEGSDANAVASSTADEEGAKPADLLSVVKDAVKKDEPAATEPPAVEGEGQVEEAEAEATPEGEDQAEADKKLPFHEHPRWKEVIAERDSFREDATRFREVESYMQTHGLTPQEVGEGFDVMAKLKAGTPEKLTEVRDYFASRLAYLDDVLGNTLPDDLRQRVEEGAVDEETAQELARTRASEKIRSTQLQARDEASTAERDRQVAVANAERCATAVDQWEQRIKASDPDYAKKAELVETTCRAIVQRTGKPPRSPEEAVALAEQGLKEVNDRLSSMLPRPKPIRAAPQGSSAKTVSEPKTLREAIAAAVSG